MKPADWIAQMLKHAERLRVVGVEEFTFGDGVHSCSVKLRRPDSMPGQVPEQEQDDTPEGPRYRSYEER